MVYVFKERITYKEYLKFIKEYSFLSYYQEDNYAKVKDIRNRLIVGVYEKKKLIGISQIFINKKKSKNEFFIPHGYLLDFTNEELVKFMTDNITNLAHKYNAYVINLYPNIMHNNSYINIIDKNLITNGYKYKNEYFDSSINLLIPLKENNKKISITNLKKQYDNEEKYLKYGVSFEISDDLNIVNKVDNIITKEYFNVDLLKKLISNFSNRVKIIIAKIDLVYYRHYLEENSDDKLLLDNINELISSGMEELDIGCATIIEPINTKNNYVEMIYNEIVEPFDKLDIMNGMIYETMKIAHKNNYDNIKISNIDLNTNDYIKRYNATVLNYIGHYYIITDKFSYLLNKEFKKRRLF